MAPPAKGRTITPLRALAVAVIGLMTAVIMYMYRTIARLHQDQQELRTELLGLQRRSGREFLEQHEELHETLRGEHWDVHGESQGHVAGGLSAAVQAGPADKRAERKLGSFTVGTAAGVGCFQIADAATVSYDVSSTSCSGRVCPDCFITPTTVSQDITLTVASCSSAKWSSRSSASRSGIWAYTIINTHASRVLSVTDSTGTTTYNVAPNTFVKAYCASSTFGVANRLVFPSTRVPTLTVDSGLTLRSGNFDASSSSGTFTTSTGANTLKGDTSVDGAKTFSTGTGNVNLNGNTLVASSRSFTVGGLGDSNVATFYGPVIVGGSTGSSTASSLTLYGHFAQNDYPDGSTFSTFSTGTGDAALNGHVTIAADKNLLMASGAGAFQTGTGTVTLNGHTTISGTNSFSTGSGAVSLNGNTAVASSRTFTVGASGSGGASTFFGAVTIGASANPVATTLYGSFSQADGTSTQSTFTTGTGSISLKGDVFVDTGKNLRMDSSGTGMFVTGTGDVSINGDTRILANKLFSTGTGGQVRLNGDTTIADSRTFTVGGTVGGGGTTQFNGNVIIGQDVSGNSAAAKDLTVYGNVLLSDAGGFTKTFTTATGAVSLMGDTNVATNKDLRMAGTGEFSTGTGPVSLNGDTTVAANKFFYLLQYSAQIACNNAAASTGDTFCKASR